MYAFEKRFSKKVRIPSSLNYFESTKADSVKITKKWSKLLKHKRPY